MCDYSLYVFKNRQAKVGDELVLHRFGRYQTIGMVCPADTNFWGALRRLLSFTEKARELCAVCIPPGAKLEARIPQQNGQDRVVMVVFDEMTAEVGSYRDGIRMPNGGFILLQHLKGDTSIRFTVLSLESQETSEEPAYSPAAVN